MSTYAYKKEHYIIVSARLDKNLVKDFRECLIASKGNQTDVIRKAITDYIESHKNDTTEG